MQSNQPHYRWLPWALSRLYYPHLILMAPWLFRKEPVPHLNSAHLISMGPSSPPLTTPDIDGCFAKSKLTFGVPSKAFLSYLFSFFPSSTSFLFLLLLPHNSQVSPSRLLFLLFLLLLLLWLLYLPHSAELPF